MLWFWAAMAFLFGTLFGALIAAAFLLEDRELKRLGREEDEDNHRSMGGTTDGTEEN